MYRVTHRVRAVAGAHDDFPAFHVLSIALTLLAAAMLNIGAFIVIIAAHAALDIVKYRELHTFSWAKTLEATLRESLLDIFFLSLALCFTLYLHHGQSVFALSGLVRFEEVFLRLFGIGLARLEVLLHGIWVFSDVRQHVRDVRDATGPWRCTEIVCLCACAASLMFIIVSPLLMGPGEAAKVLGEQLVPWRI